MQQFKRLLIVGASGHAKVLIDIAEKSSYEVVGLIDDFQPIGTQVVGYNILGGVKDIVTIYEEHSIEGFFIGIGDNYARERISAGILDMLPTAVFATLLHPSAQVGKEVKIGEGSALMAGAVVNSASTLGRHVIVNTNSSIDHDCTLCDYASVAPNVGLSGNVRIGRGSAIGIGTNIIQKVSIGDYTVVGAGSTVLENIECGTLAYGSPAKVAKKRDKTDKYL